MIKNVTLIGIAGVVAVALSSCGPRCHTISQEVAYLDESGEVAFRTMEREICAEPVKTDMSDSVHSGSGSMTADMISKKK